MYLNLYCQKPQEILMSKWLEGYSEDHLTPKVRVKTISCRWQGMFVFICLKIIMFLVRAVPKMLTYNVFQLSIAAKQTAPRFRDFKQLFHLLLNL